MRKAEDFRPYSWWGLKQDGEIVSVLGSDHPLTVEDFDDIPLNENCEYVVIPVSVKEVTSNFARGVKSASHD